MDTARNGGAGRLVEHVNRQGRDSMGSDATLPKRRRDQNLQGPRSERLKPDCKMAKSISLTTPYCNVTGAELSLIHI